MREKEEAMQKMRQLEAGSTAEVLAVLRNTSQAQERRVAAAEILGAHRVRDAVLPLIEALTEGERHLSLACMRALLLIRSRRHARRLIEVASGKYPLTARQEAIYALWQLKELRAEPVFLRVSAAIDTEEEYTRDMATEALGNSALRPRTQRALAERLFDPSPSIRYAALCACARMNRNYGPCEFPGFLRRALEAKLDDPDRVDDNRVIAEFAAELLGARSCQS
jgi:HEAT repeat protein